MLAAGARARGRALLAGRRWLRARSIPIEPMKFYSLPTLAQGEASTTFGDAGPKSGFLHIWGRRGAGRGADGGGRGGRRIQLRGPADTHSGPECVSTCAGYRFGYECVAGGYTFGVRTCIDLRGVQLRVRTCGGRIHIRRPNVYRRASRQVTRYKPYLATACRMRAPHGTQIAARKPTVAAPCRQSHGRPAAYAATIAGQVMGST